MGSFFTPTWKAQKPNALKHNPRVALCFYWANIDKQVRIRGRAELVSDDEADAYFATRPRLSQISAWASKQSHPMRNYFELEAAGCESRCSFRTWTRSRGRHFGRDFGLCRSGLSFGSKSHFVGIIASCMSASLMVGAPSGCFRSSFARTAQQNATGVNRVRVVPATFCSQMQLLWKVEATHSRSRRLAT